MSLCDKLKDAIDRGIVSMKDPNNKAPGFVIADWVADMSSGEAEICQKCSEYKNCFPDCQPVKEESK